MKRTELLPSRYAGGGSVVLALSLLFLPGCSGGGDGAGKVVGNYGLDQSELNTLKKANKKPQDFKKALMKLQIDKLQEAGVVVERTTSRKTTKKGR